MVIIASSKILAISSLFYYTVCKRYATEIDSNCFQQTATEYVATQNTYFETMKCMNPSNF